MSCLFLNQEWFLFWPQVAIDRYLLDEWWGLWVCRKGLGQVGTGWVTWVKSKWGRQVGTVYAVKR